MAIIKRKEISGMNEEALRKRLAEFRLELSKARSQIIVGGSAANPGRIKEQRKVVARILTELHKRKNNIKNNIKITDSLSPKGDTKNTSSEKSEESMNKGGV
jgi:large subunit ribosomal protein L29